MVKGRASCSSPASSQRPCPPLASLSLASSHLKPSARPSPLFTSLLKRPPFVAAVHTESSPAMDYPPSPCASDPFPSSAIYGMEAHTLKEDSAIEADAAALGHMSIQHGSKTAGTRPPLPVEDEDAPDIEDQAVSLCGRQRLQQHRIQMSGKVIIPETWGREHQLQEWVSFGIVEDALRPAGLMAARTALVKECQRHRGNKSVHRTPPAMSADVEVS